MDTAHKKSIEKLIRYSIGALLFLVAINAFGGGLYGMIGAEGIPAAWLTGTPFHSYFMPGLILFVGVGGSSLFASIAVFKRYQIAGLATFVCCMMLFGWIIVQVALIGYVSWLQPAIIIVAGIILILTWLLRKYEH